MIEKRSFDSLGRFRNDWLNARHHFSFGGYHDPSRMGWGTIRVWNDDEIAPQSGFDPHPHADMEIITYVRDGAITHKDSLGNQGRTAAGDVQVMSAGTGIVHAEYNLESELTRIYQIWITPTQRGLAPSWDAAAFPKGDRSGRFAVLASGFDEDGAVPKIRTPSRVLGASLAAGEAITYTADPDRHQYLGVAKGSVSVNGIDLGPRDAAAITAETDLVITGNQDAEIVLVDAP
jgi:quercetin 2,3-dioxygenase